MQVVNTHHRVIHQPKAKLTPILDTLSQQGDKLWPYEKWPGIKLDAGLQVGSLGGHGPIGYRVIESTPGKQVTFEFTKPKGFEGTHTFSMKSLSDESTELQHEIKMRTNGLATLSWTLGIRWLHDALIEDAFDKVENQFTTSKKSTKWTLWVKILRTALK